MLTPASGKLPALESVWGVEALDPLAQFEWAGDLWTHVMTPHFIPRPFLLLYSPSAERTALRCLRTLSRLARRRNNVTTFFSMPGEVPLLNSLPSEATGLFLVHHASRFLDLPEWLGMRLVHHGCKVVITCPVDELFAVAGHRHFEQARLPEEEPDYCAHQAAGLIAKFWRPGAAAMPSADTMIQILVEAGMAGVELPLELLARSFRLDLKNLRARLESAPLREFVRYANHDMAVENHTVTFRGQWLAASMAGEARVGHYPLLAALLEDLTPSVRSHRLFLLNLLVALRAQGFPEQAAQLQAVHERHIEAARELAGARERLAWDLFFHHGLLKLVSIVLYLAEKKLRFSPKRKTIPFATL